jgi:hypothetical protein
MAIISDIQEEEAAPPQQQQAAAPAAVDVDLEVLEKVLERKGGPLPFLHAAIDVAHRRSDLFRDPSAVGKITAMASAARAQVEAEERKVRDAKRKAAEVEKKAAAEKERAVKAAAEKERAAVTEERGAGSSGEKDSAAEAEKEESKAQSEYPVFVVLLLLILLLGFDSIPMLNVVVISNVDLASSYASVSSALMLNSGLGFVDRKSVYGLTPQLFTHCVVDWLFRSLELQLFPD